MKKTILIIKRTLKQTFRNWESWVQILIVPIVFLGVTAWLYGEGSGYTVDSEHGNVFKVGVINNDNFESLADIVHLFKPYLENNNSKNPLQIGFADHFINNINRSNQMMPIDDHRQFDLVLFTEIEEVVIAIKQRFISICFILNENFSQTVLAGLNQKITILENRNISNESRIIQSVSDIEILGDPSNRRFSEAINLLEIQVKNYWSIYAKVDLPGKIEIATRKIISINITEFHTFIPAFFVMTLLMSGSGIAVILARETDRRTIERIKLSNLSRFDYLTGLSITQFITTIMTVLVFMGTIFFLNFPYFDRLIFAIPIGIISIFPVLGLSLISVIIFEKELAIYAPGLFAIPLSFLSGSFVPLPRTYLWGDVQLWHLNPFYSTSEALRKILFLNYDLNQVKFEIFLLLFLGLLLFITGLLLFTKKGYETD
ncbi:MAG: ABC transporter permease [Candidatus Hodarchaeales archaeon]|jgi:hypothetical protein